MKHPSPSTLGAAIAAHAEPIAEDVGQGYRVMAQWSHVTQGLVIVVEAPDNTLQTLYIKPAVLDAVLRLLCIAERRLLRGAATSPNPTQPQAPGRLAQIINYLIR